MVIVVMGMAGAGKTTVGTCLAMQIGWRFFDADSFHPAVNIAKMRRGIPLTDADREPWLIRVQTLIAGLLAYEVSAVIACSALKRRYRERLWTGHPDVRLVYLKADYALLRRRLAQRRGHFVGADLLPSQIEILEEPVAESAVIVDAALPPEEIVAAIRQALSL